MLITIDGYAGSGKTSVAKRLAETLGYQLLHTGAMYRATAIVLEEAKIDIHREPRDVATIKHIVAEFTFEMPGTSVILNGRDMTPLVDGEGMGAKASKVSTFAEVREKLKAEQRRLASGGCMVCEGRDQGTTVFPDAPLKFFLHASAEVRADRRLAQDGTANRAEVLAQIIARDKQDETRPLDPLRRADDAIDIDTTTMSEDEVHQFIVDEFNKKTAAR